MSHRKKLSTLIPELVGDPWANYRVVTSYSGISSSRVVSNAFTCADRWHAKDDRCGWHRHRTWATTIRLFVVHPEHPMLRRAPVLDRVIFRRFVNTREVIAILPDAGPCNRGHVMSYLHVGQHGEASKAIVCSSITEPVNAAGYAPLLAELRSLGYVLRVCKRLPAHSDNCWS